jgi:hypothetical protein
VINVQSEQLNLVNFYGSGYDEGLYELVRVDFFNDEKVVFNEIFTKGEEVWKFEGVKNMGDVRG